MATINQVVQSKSGAIARRGICCADMPGCIHEPIMRSAEEFGRHLKYLRETVLAQKYGKRVTQGDIVARIHRRYPDASSVGQNAIARYELGMRIPKRKNLEMLAYGYETTVGDLLGLERAEEEQAEPYPAWEPFLEECAAQIAVAKVELGPDFEWVMDKLKTFRLEGGLEMTVDTYLGLLLWYVGLISRNRHSKVNK